MNFDAVHNLIFREKNLIKTGSVAVVMLATAALLAFIVSPVALRVLYWFLGLANPPSTGIYIPYVSEALVGAFGIFLAFFQAFIIGSLIGGFSVFSADVLFARVALKRPSQIAAGAAIIFLAFGMVWSSTTGKISLGGTFVLIVFSLSFVSGMISVAGSIDRQRAIRDATLLR